MASPLDTLRSLAALLPGAVVEERRDGIACLRRPDTATLTGRLDVLARVCLEGLERRKVDVRAALDRAETYGERNAYEAAFEDVVRADCSLREGLRLAKEAGL